LHGEYKTPAGKLVVVDFGVEDGNMSNVVVSGDFFLEPPEALADIVRALEGAPADLGEEGLAGRIRETLDEGVEMVGFSANRYWDAWSRASRSRPAAAWHRTPSRPKSSQKPRTSCATPTERRPGSTRFLEAFSFQRSAFSKNK
jgi:lipoate-protein ligase A